MMKKPQPDRFAMAEEIAAEPETPGPSPAPATTKKTKAKQPGTRKPNVEYERDGRIYVKAPREICDRLDLAILAERKKRRPTPMDKGIAIEEAIMLWLEKHGHHGKKTR